MKTIAERAVMAVRSFAPDTYDEKRIGIACYIKGAEEEHSLLTEWHDCATPPFHERRVLVKDGYDEIQLAWYDVAAEEWHELSGGGAPMFWRDIHE